MTRTWPHESIPDSAHLPPGAYLLEVSEINETHPRDSEKLMYAVSFSVAEPAQFAGLVYYENFVVGSDEDPDAQDPDTWRVSVGARILKRVLKAAGVEIVDDIDETLAAAQGQHVVAIITEQMDDGKRDPRYKGRLRNASSGWYAPGEREVGVDGSQAPAAATAPAAPARKPPAAVPARAAIASAKPATLPARAPAAPARAATATAAAPARPAAKPVAKADAVKCTICGQAIARAEFIEHVEGHEREE